MGLFENKRRRELEKEKEELLIRLNNITEREDNVRQLNDILKKMRVEVADLNERKLNLSSEIESLREQKKQIKVDIETLNKEILNLKNLKLEEQNTLLEYSARIDKIKNQINNDEDLKNLDIELEPELLANRSKQLENLSSEYEELRDKIFVAEERIDELNSLEDELSWKIKEKKKELESLNNEKLRQSYREANEVEDKIIDLTHEQQKIIDDIQRKQTEITELNKNLLALKEKENASNEIIQELNEELQEKQKQSEFLDKKISDLYEEEDSKRRQLRELVRQADEQKQ